MRTAAPTYFVPILFAIGLIGATTRADASDRVDTPDAAEQSSSWGPVAAGSLGVLFGAAIAAWQIRGRRRD